MCRTPVDAAPPKLKPAFSSLSSGEDGENSNDPNADDVPLITSSGSCVACSTSHWSLLAKIDRAIFPISPWLVVACIPLLPSWCFVNRGYTQWFHWCALVYALTRNAWWCQFVAVQGLTVCLGWYASLIVDLVVANRWAHLLYLNMPDVMSQVMFDRQTGQLLYTTDANLVKLMAHALDTLSHTLLCYFFWRTCYNRGLKTFSQIAMPWSILIATYSLSRLWSITQSYVNTGNFALHYYGTQVYVLPSPDDVYLYTPSYVVEGGFFVAAILYKLFWERRCEVHSNGPKCSERTTAAPSIKTCHVIG